MGDMTDDEYATIADRLADPDAPGPPPVEVLTGAAAAAAGREFLVREYGSIEAVEAVVRGRPRTGSSRSGPSPTVRGRVTPRDHAALLQMAEQTGLTQSDLVRLAVHELLARHAEAMR